jgi:hypothetical protein
MPNPDLAAAMALILRIRMPKSDEPGATEVDFRGVRNRSIYLRRQLPGSVDRHRTVLRRTGRQRGRAVDGSDRGP